MNARAILPLTGPHGTFPKGAPIIGVPEEIVAVWVGDGAAELIPAAPEPDETATAPPPETPDAPPAETGTVSAPETATAAAGPVRARKPKGG